MIVGLAPMDGFTDCAFRQVVKEIFDKYGEKRILDDSQQSIAYSKKNKNNSKSSIIDHGLKTNDLYLRTEFMNADGYVINPPGVIKHLLTDKSQKNVIAQIFGSEENMLVQCFRDIEKKYFLNVECRMQNAENSELGTLNSKFTFAGIELNMGCPARNVMNTGGGSALLKDRKKTLELIKKLRKTVKMPFSIKTRTGIDEKDTKKQMEFLIEASNYVDMISVHGRTTKQIYSGNADWKFIYELKKKANKKCKILGNGGIKKYEDIKKFLHCHFEQSEESDKNLLYPSLYSGGQSECLDGVMIGQAAIGNPRIFTPHTPDRKELKETILKHLDYMIAYEQVFQEEKKKITGILNMPNHPKIQHKEIPQIVIVEFRKHLFQYLKGIPGSKGMKQKLSTIVEYESLVKAIQEFFG